MSGTTATAQASSLTHVEACARCTCHGTYKSLIAAGQSQSLEEKKKNDAWMMAVHGGLNACGGGSRKQRVVVVVEVVS